MKRRLRVLAHYAYFQWGPDSQEQIFVKVTNMHDQPVELTHVWFQGELSLRTFWRRRYWTAGEGGTHLFPHPSQLVPVPKLPARLQPYETFETWVRAELVPGKWQLWRARAKLSSGSVYLSRPNRDVPDFGNVAGGGNAPSTD
jgi:hypothetical protein